MKKNVKILGIIALAAVIGFSIMACSDDDDGPAPYRTFITVTDILPDYNGKIGTLVLSTLDPEYPADGHPEPYVIVVYSTEEKINIESTTFPLLFWENEYPWSGSDTFNITILIFNDRTAAVDGPYIYAGVVRDVEITEGTTSIAWSSFDIRLPNANLLQAYFQKR